MTSAGWEAVIGLEVHVQLATDSKLFCAASTGFGAEANTHIDPVSLGMPGVLPVLNREAVSHAIRLGLALGCKVHHTSRFARKHYFYPDLPKGYQISQFSHPICTGGGVWAEVDGQDRFFELTRIHMEEDAGKTIHDSARGVSAVDYNRAGVPLVETVSEPCMRSAEEAVAYMKALHQVVVALGVCHGNMERGNFRCDANVSVRRVGDQRLGTKVELKNINSFRFVGRGIEYEIARQIAQIESGKHVTQETRLWDDEAGVTRIMRTKEEAHDYRYFPDPDLMPLVVEPAWIERLRSELPELPRARRARLIEDYGLSDYDASVMNQSTARATYFETVARTIGDPKLAANWIQGEILGLLNRDGLDVDDSPISAIGLGELLVLVKSGELSGKLAKRCFAEMVQHGVSAKDWVAKHGGQITDEGEIEVIVTPILDDHPDEVSQYLEGKTKVLGFFVGQVMRRSQGRANPAMVNVVIKRLMEARR